MDAPRRSSSSRSKPRSTSGSCSQLRFHSFDARRSATLRARLYEDFVFLHDETSEAGRELAERYRVANDVAHRFVRRLERDYIGHARFGELHAELWRFFHIGQEGKLRLGRAA